MHQIRISILPKFSANIKRRQLTEFLENAQILGYSTFEAVHLLCILQGVAP